MKKSSLHGRSRKLLPAGDLTNDSIVVQVYPGDIVWFCQTCFSSLISILLDFVIFPFGAHGLLAYSVF